MLKALNYIPTIYHAIAKCSKYKYLIAMTNGLIIRYPMVKGIFSALARLIAGRVGRGRGLAAEASKGTPLTLYPSNTDYGLTSSSNLDGYKLIFSGNTYILKQVYPPLANRVSLENPPAFSDIGHNITCNSGDTIILGSCGCSHGVPTLRIEGVEGQAV
jgi:hypothetical protein